MEAVTVEKPVSLPVNQWLIRKMSLRTMVPERVIEKVINHQFASALDAMGTCNSLEFSGFGKVFFNKKKAVKKMQKFLSQKALFQKWLDDPELSPTKRRSTEFKLQTTLDNIEALKPKVDDKDIRDL